MSAAVLHHLIIAPILLPLVMGAAMLLFEERQRTVKVVLTLATLVALLVVGVLLLLGTNEVGPDGAGETLVYLLGNWPAPFGIVLVADRLSALMLVLTAVLAASSFLFSLARWHRAGPRFYSLFLFLLMGLNGAFLTGDLFNLFVFFEVMLAASYGLVLHGSGTARVKAGLHYIPINLVASSLFLVGVSLIYGVTGTLNMADVARHVAGVADGDRMLLEAGAAILAIAFLLKAGMWPLSFWLPTTYAAASAPVAAMFAIMTKVGVYVILRLFGLVFGAAAGPSADFGGEWLFYGGLATVTFGAIGVLASQSMNRLAGYSVLVSSGTLLAAIGTSDPRMISGALYYLVSSTLAISAFFLLIELIERGRVAGADVLAVSMEVFGDMEDESDDVSEEVGVSLPLTLAALGGAFLCCTLLLAGLPPLSGFIGKLAMVAAVLGAEDPISPSSWALIAVLMISSFAALIAMTRTGINTFWTTADMSIPSVKAVEFIPVLGLLAICFALTIFAGPAMRFTDATAITLEAPTTYVEDVLMAPRAGPASPSGAPR